MRRNTETDRDMNGSAESEALESPTRASGAARAGRRWRPALDVRVLAVCATAVLITLLFLASRMTQEETAFSPLYRTTLEQAYSRFREADVRVPAGRAPRKPVDPGLEFADKRPGAVTDRESDEFVAADKLQKSGDLEGALQGFRLALTKYPRSTLIRHKIGDILQKTGEWKEAVNFYREVLQRDATQLCCYEHMAEIFREHDQPEMADRMLQNAMGGYRLWIQAGGTAAQRGMHDLATLYLREKRQPEEALELAEHLVKSLKNDISLFLLARCLANVGQRARALEVLKEVAPTDAPSIRMVEEFRTSLLAQDGGAPK